MYRSTNCHKKSRLLAVRFPDLNFTWELGWTFPVRNWDFGFLNAMHRAEFTLTFFYLNATTEWLISNFLKENNEVCLTFRTKSCSVSSGFTYVSILQFSCVFSKIFDETEWKQKMKLTRKITGKKSNVFELFHQWNRFSNFYFFSFGFRK